jgi:hypothetical protein
MSLCSFLGRVLRWNYLFFPLFSPCFPLSQSCHNQWNHRTREQRSVNRILMLCWKVQKRKHAWVKECSRRKGERTTRVVECFDQGCVGGMEHLFIVR